MTKILSLTLSTDGYHLLLVQIGGSEKKDSRKRVAHLALALTAASKEPTLGCTSDLVDLLPSDLTSGWSYVRACMFVVCF